VGFIDEQSHRTPATTNDITKRSVAPLGFAWNLEVLIRDQIQKHRRHQGVNRPGISGDSIS
jgi:hypothetical protein